MRIVGLALVTLAACVGRTGFDLPHASGGAPGDADAEGAGGDAAGSDDELPGDGAPDLTALAARVTALEQAVAAQAVEIDARAEVLAGLELCPPGYAHDPSRTDIVLCTRGRDELVGVAGFWVDRYEASVWPTPECTGACPDGQACGALSDNYPATFPYTGNVSSPANLLYACSVAGVQPAGFTNPLRAAQACAASGKHLITDPEWQLAAAATPDPGTNDGTTNTRCHTDGVAGRPTALAGVLPGDAGGCISRYGVEDAIGSLWEWTAGAFVTGQRQQALDGERRTPWPSAFRSDATFNLNGTAQNGGYQAGMPAARTRGGSFDYGTSAGVFCAYIGKSVAWDSDMTGFRCARRR